MKLYSLKTKIMAFGGILIVIMSLIVLFSQIAIKKLNDRDNLRIVASDFNECAKLRLLYSRYRKPEFEQIFNEKMENADKILEIDSDDERIKDFINQKRDYEALFEKFTTMMRKRGLNENLGIEGNFRNSVHAIEYIIENTNEYPIMNDMLQARRSEKDFIMRSREEYPKKVEKAISNLMTHTRSLIKDPYLKDSILNLAAGYITQFRTIVTMYGDLENLQKNIDRHETDLLNNLQSIVNDNAETTARMETFLLTLALFAVVIGIVLSLLISNLITKPVKKLGNTAQLIAAGDFSEDNIDMGRDEIGELANAFSDVKQTVQNLIYEVKFLTDSASAGNLSVRGNPNKFKGVYRDIIAGFNQTMDNVILPFNLAAEYVDNIAKGNIPEKITKNLPGDFDELKNNLNICIDSINLLLEDAELLSQAAGNEELTKRADSSRHSGDYAKLIKGVNNTLDSIVEKVHWYESILDSIPYPICVTDNNLFWSFLNRSAENILKIDRLKIKSNQCCNLSDQACEGDKCKALDIPQGDLSPYLVHKQPDKDYKYDKAILTNLKGIPIGHVEVVQDVTEMNRNRKIQKEMLNKFEKIANYQNKNSEHLTKALIKMADGNFDFNLQIEPSDSDTENIRTMFDKIAIALDRSINAVRLLVEDANSFAFAAAEGNLNYRTSIDRHSGEYRSVMKEINSTVKSLIEPINGASQILEIISTGDLTQVMEGVFKGDFQKLADSINGVILSLNDLIKEVDSAVSSVALAADEISGATEALTVASMDQKLQTQDVAAAVEEMSSTANENSRSANKTSEVARDNGRVAREGARVMEETIKKMHDIAEVVKISAENIQKLGESGKRISEILSVIDDIADQTNLLALNAAIEAARAGDHGRGFAVVADEVRKLAERTTGATKQIEIMILGIQKETEIAVTEMMKGTAEVTEGISLADKAGESLKQILNSSETVLEMVDQIAAASVDQSKNSEEIAKSVTTISRLTADSTENIGEIAEASEKLRTLTLELTEAMSRFKVNRQSDQHTHSHYSPFKRNLQSPLKSKLLAVKNHNRK